MKQQNTIRAFIHRNVERQLVREYLLRETERAGFGGLSFNRTPEGTKVTLQAEQVGRVIGRRGKVIHELQRRLQNDFILENPHLDVEEVAESRLSAQIMASRLASSLERGWFFRRAGHSTAQNIMDAGARGCLVILSGKITGPRHRVEKFQKGHVKFCGETALEFMDTGFSTAVKTRYNRLHCQDHATGSQTTSRDRHHRAHRLGPAASGGGRDVRGLG